MGRVWGTNQAKEIPSTRRKSAGEGGKEAVPWKEKVVEKQKQRERERERCRAGVGA